MNRSKKLVGLIVGILSLVGIVAVGCGDKSTGKKPTQQPTTQSEWGVYYYDYNGSEYLLSLADGNTVTIILDNVVAYGKYTRKDNDLMFTYTNDDLDVKTAKINAGDSIITLTYNNVPMPFLRRVIYDVTFNSAEGSDVATVQVLNGKSLGKPSDPVRAGYTFLGWYKDNEYKTPFIFESDIISANTTLYAQWGKSTPGENVYTVKFDVGDYEGAVNPQPQKTVGGKIYSLTKPTRDGYTFVGWWYSVTGKADELTYEVDLDTVYNESTTLYAVWQGAREGGKLLSPAVSVVGNRISWDTVAQAAQYRVQVECEPSDTNQVFDTIDRSMTETSTEVAFNIVGKYTVTVTAISSTGASNNSEPTTRTYLYNPLARVSLFNIVSDTLLWNAVDNAEKYIVSVDCGNANHGHSAFDNGRSTYFSLANCEMQRGGIKVTVTAVANGYASSTSDQYVYSKDLDAVPTPLYDEDTQTVSWQAVPNATNYEISLICGTTGHAHTQLDLGNTTSYCLKNCAVPEGGLMFSVTPRTKGYNSPDPTVLNITAEQKSAPVTPDDIRIVETTLSWGAVEADKYVVRIGDKEIEATANSLDLSKQEVNWTKGSDYNIRVKAVKGDKSSLWSDALDARYYAMYSTLNYNKNTVSWRPVIGAQGYDVRVNEGVAIKVTNGATSARVKLTEAGDNKIEVRFYIDDQASAWAPITVKAYTLTLDTRGGVAVAGVGLEQYYAIGDEITLPKGNDITKEGYSLGDFYTTPGGPDGNGARFTDKVYTAAGDMILYASWTPKTYKITLNYNNGGTGVAEATVTYGKPFRLPTPDTIKDGTTVFGGWCANSIGTAASYTDENGNSILNWTIARDTVVYAKWLSVYGFEKQQGGSAGYYYMLTAGAGRREVVTATIPATYKGPEDSVAYPVTQIGTNAFDSCVDVQVINLPSTIETIQPQTFDSYTTLREINVYQAPGVVNDTYFSDGGVLYYNNTTAGETQLWAVPRAKTGIYTVSNKASTISSYVFSRSALDEVKIPANVTLIENNAFNNSNITVITFLSPAVGAKVELLQLEEDALYYARKMTEITLPARPIAIVDGNRKAIDAPDFNTQVFRDCSALTDIYVDTTSAYYQSIGGLLCSKGVDATVLYCPKGRDGVLELPTGVVKIGRRAFSGCLDITEVKIPNWVIEIGEEAFSGYDQKIEGSKYDASVKACTSLSKVTFLGGDGVAAGLAIGKNAFGNKDSKAYQSVCSALTTIEFKSGSGVAEIGEYAFARCPITTIILPATLEELKEGAFYGCAKLETVEYAPNGKDITVGDQVFANCTGITTIKLPANITVFNDGVFAGCNKLANIEVDPNNPALSDVDGVLFSKDKTIIIFYPAGRSGNYSIPNTVTEISGGAFSDKENITDITIGKNVTKIGAGAFRHCVNLQTVTFEDGGTATLVIGESAFNGCTNLLSFKIPSRVTEITDRMLMNTNRLTELVIPDTITSIGRLAFANLAYVSTIEKIVIPSSVADIGVLAFYNCGAKEIEFTDKESGDLTIESPEEKINSKISTSNWLDEYFPVALEAGESGLFRSCFRLQKITLPKGLKNMPAAMFTGCSQLDEVVVPGTVTKIGNTVFANCRSLKTITFAEREIDSETGKVLALELEDGYKKSEDKPDGNGGQEKIDVYYGVFAGCTGLTSIELPEGTTRIPDYAFGNCTGLISITIPTTVQNGEFTKGESQVTAIGTDSFIYCTKLTTVIFTPGGTGDFSLGVRSFSHCDKLTSITLPARLADANVHITQIYSSATIYDEDLQVSGVRTGHISGIGTQSATATNSDRDQYLVTLNNRSFYYCPNLAAINVAPGGTHYSSDDGILYTADMSELVFVPYGRIKEIVVPYTVSLVRNFAFAGEYTDKHKVSTVTFLNAPATATADEGNDEGQPVAATELRIGEVFQETTYYSSKITAAPFANSVISSITFPDRLSYIGEYAFYNCGNLTSITLPDATTKIDNYAFNNSKKLSTLTISKNSKLNHIGNYAFAQTGLSSIYLPPAKSFTLGENIFQNCTKLTSVSIPNTISSFDGLFTGSYAISDLNIYTVKDEDGNDVVSSMNSQDGIIFTNGGKTLAYYPAGRTDREYEIPVGVTTISKGAFNSNSYLQTVTIPNTVSLIGDNAFVACAGLKTVIFEKDDVVDDAHCVLLTDEEKSTYSGARYTKNADGTYTKSESGEYKSIAATTLTVGESTSTSNDSRAHVFANCIELEKVYFPARLESLAKFSFYYCKNLTTVTFDEGCRLGMIRDRVFMYTSLQYGGTREQIATDPTHQFEIPASVSTIEGGSAGTFGTKITKLTIPATVSTIGNNAFDACASLQSVTFLGSPTIGTYMFRKCTNLQSVTLPSNLTTISSSMFADCTSLEQISIPSNVTKIDGSAFSGCTALTKVVLPASGLTTINGSAFLKCASLAKITYDEKNTEYDLYLPSSVTTIAASAFAGTAITSAYIPGSITTLTAIFSSGQTNDPTGSNASNIIICPNLRTVTFDQVSWTATSMPANMFLQMSALEEVALPTKAMTTINAGAFAWSGIKRITIPANITTINRAAFSNCAKLEYVKFAAGSTALTLTAASQLSTSWSNSYQYAGVFAESGKNNGRAEAKAKAEAADATQADKDAYAANFKIDMSERKITTTNKWTLNGLQNLDVLLSDETTTISTLTFQGAAIDKIVVPANVTTIQIAAFARGKIKEVEFASSTNNLTIAAGTSTTVDASLGVFAYCSELTKVDMSKRGKITAIPNYTFYGCDSLTDILWSVKTPATEASPNMVTNTTTIGNYAFRSAFAPAITTLNLPEGITTIGTWAFNDTPLKTITFPSTLTSIGERAFSTYTARDEYTGLTCALVIPGHVTTIGNYAFADTPITGLTFAKYKNSDDKDVSDLTTISNGAFWGTNISQVTLPASLTTLDTNAFYNTPSLASVTFEDGSKLTLIGNYAFRGSGLTSVTIPKSVTTIGNYAFGVSPDLTTVTFQKDEDGNCALTTLNEGAFYGTGLTTVSIPKSVTSIGGYAFQNSESLATVTFEKDGDGNCGLTTLGVSAFNNTGLTAVSIPKSVTTIGNYAFGDCPDLATVTFEKDGDGACALTSIGAAAFRKTAIAAIEIPKSVTSLGANPFRGCANLVELTVEDGSTQFAVEDNVLYSTDKSILYIYAAGLEGEFELPDSVVEISDYAFSGSKFSGALTVTKEGFTVGYAAFYDSLVSGISFGDSAIIGEWAFEACESLASVTLGESATICKGAFSGCTTLANVVLGDKVKVGSQAFEDCEALTAVTLPAQATVDYTSFDGSGVTLDDELLKDDTAIKYNYNGTELDATMDGAIVFDTVATAAAALKANADLEYIVLAEGITEIANSTFKNIANLKKIKLPSTLTKIGAKAFEGCGLEELFIPKNVEFLLTKTFYNCKSLTKVVFEKGSKVKMFYTASATTIPSATSDTSTFAGCSNLTSVTLPDGMEVINYKSFQTCTSLTSISIPATVQYIYGWAFEGCTALEGVTFEKDKNGECALTLIGDYSFGGTSISEISVYRAVTKIGTYAFRNCTSLTSVTFEKDADGNCELTYFGNYAFYNTGLTSISLPKTYTGGSAVNTSGVLTAATNVFQNCASLTSVTFETDSDGNNDLAVIGGNTFNGTAITSVTIPKGVTAIGDSAFRGTAITSVTIPKGVVTIGANAFDGCESLASVTFEKDGDGNCAFTYTGNYAFANTALTSISLPKTYTGGSTVNSSGTLTAATFVFYNCASLTSVTFEKDGDGNCDVKTFGESIFNGTALSEISIPATVTNIGKNAFHATSIEAVAIPAAVTNIGDYAFAECPNLSSVTWDTDADGNYADKVSFGNFSFTDCQLLKNMILPPNFSLNVDRLSGFGSDCTIYVILLPGPFTTSCGSNEWLRGCEAKFVWGWQPEWGFLKPDGTFENKGNTDSGENTENTTSLAA